jgi:hypothetical protein
MLVLCRKLRDVFPLRCSLEQFPTIGRRNAASKILDLSGAPFTLGLCLRWFGFAFEFAFAEPKALDSSIVLDFSSPEGAV